MKGPPAPRVDPELRRRLRRWLRYYWETRYEAAEMTQAQMAADLGIKGPTLSNALAGVPGRDSIGLDLVVAMHRTFHVETDRLLDGEPPGSTALPRAASGTARH